MNKKTDFSNFSMKDSNWEFLMEGFGGFIKSIIKQTMEEWWQKKTYENVMVEKNLTAKELCELWKISDTTLLTWEKQGKISPLQMGGRKKLYSMRDIKKAEANLNINRVA